jgi:hypothetical protein
MAFVWDLFVVLGLVAVRLVVLVCWPACAKPRGQGCAQLPLCDLPSIGPYTGCSTTNVAAQQGYERSDGTLTRRIPIPLWMWSATTAPFGDSPAFPLGVEPPAGIEPATPSLP